MEIHGMFSLIFQMDNIYMLVALDQTTGLQLAFFQLLYSDFYSIQFDDIQIAYHV